MNSAFKTIIIDDEKPARSRLKRLLEQYKDIIEIVAEAENGEEGLIQIETFKPDLIFLDIQMPGLTGFEVLKKLKHVPIVVFATAYEEYAIKAFEQNSMDYLLKPIEAERLHITIEKLKKHKANKQPVDVNGILSFLEKITPAKQNITSIPVKKGDRILLIRLEEIAYFEAKEKYVFIHNMEGNEFLIDHTLSTLEEKLPPDFIRAHRAFIVNKNKIKEVQKYFDGKFVLVLNDASVSKIISGASYYKEVKALTEI